jgi:hypothetical protein
MTGTTSGARIPFPSPHCHDELMLGEVPDFSHPQRLLRLAPVKTLSPGLVALEGRHTSRRTVNGPSATLRTSIIAPNRPVATVAPWARSRVMTSSINNWA